MALEDVPLDISTSRAAVADRPQGCGESVRTAGQARLSHLRQALRAGRSQPHLTLPGKAVLRSRAGRSRNRVPRRVPLGAASSANDWSRPFARFTARWPERTNVSSSRSPAAKVRRLIFSSKDPRPTGHCRYRSRKASRPDAQRDCYVSPSTSTACRPARVAKGAALTFTAVSPTDAIEVQARLD